eukprot:s3622_g1.t1
MLTARSRALLAARVSLDSGTKACRFGRTEVIHFEVEEPAPSPCSRSSDHGREAFAFRQAQQKTKNDDVEKDEKETDEDETDSDDNATFFYQPPLRGEASRTAKLKTLRSDETVVTLGEFIAILQCSRPVGRPFRNSLELERSATSRVRKDFAPIRRGLRDLKQGIRSASSELEGQVASFPEAGTGRALAASTSLPDLREVEAPFARKTFQRISSTLSRVPDLDEMGTKIVEIRDGIGGYFESHHRSLSCHEELLEQPVPSRVFGPLRLRTRQASSIIVCSCRDRAPHLGTSLPRTCARSWPGSLPSHLR